MSKKDIQQKISYICNLLLKIFSIFFIIIIVQMVKGASEVIIKRRISTSAIRIYIRNIFVFVFFLGVLPTVFAHPACRAHQHPFDSEPCRFEQLHLLILHHSLTSNLNIHNSIFIILALHLYFTSVHTFTFSYLKTIRLFHVIQPFIYTIAIKYIDTIILRYLSHTFVYSLTLEYTNITWPQ